MALIFRNTGPWGPGKLARLTSLEVDGNMADLDGRVQALEDNPPEALSIDHFTVAGNLLTVHMSDGSTQGPFTLPAAQWRWLGEWQPATQYYGLDVLAHGGSVYLVQHDHMSAGAFDAAAEGTDGFFYALLLAPFEQPYDVGMFYAGALPGDGSTLLSHAATRPFVLGDTFADSVAYLAVAVSTENLSLPVQQNGIDVGAIEFTIGENVDADGGQLGSFVGLSPSPSPSPSPPGIHFARTDRLTVLAADVADATAAGLSVTFAGRQGLI